MFWPFRNQTFPEIDQDVKRIHTSVYGAELLGSPIVGPEDYFINCFGNCVHMGLDAQNILPELEISQVTIQLLVV